MLGVIADDFTGASDIASFLVENGLSTVQMNGVPTQSLNIVPPLTVQRKAISVLSRMLY